MKLVRLYFQVNQLFQYIFQPISYGLYITYCVIPALVQIVIYTIIVRIAFFFKFSKKEIVSE